MSQHAARRSPAAPALVAIVVWLAVEVAVQRLGRPAVQDAIARLTGAPDPAALRTAAVVITLVVTMGLLIVIFGALARRAGLTPADLGYRWSRGAVRAGVRAGLALLAVLLVTAAIDRAALDRTGDAVWLRRLAEASPRLVVAILLANGVLAPVVEEYAWRGYIQRRLVQSWGAVTGIAVTASAFALKHVLVDLTLTRLTTLVIGALGLGLIAARWGTGASTVAHALANIAATLLVTAQARL
jgi:hypothetical protein